MDQKFKKYLEDKGLKIVQILSIAMPASFGFLCKLKLILVDCYFYNYRFCYCLLQWNLSLWSLHIIRKPRIPFLVPNLYPNHLIRKLLWSLPVCIRNTILVPNHNIISPPPMYIWICPQCHLFNISCISFFWRSILVPLSLSMICHISESVF